MGCRLCVKHAASQLFFRETTLHLLVSKIGGSSCPSKHLQNFQQGTASGVWAVCCTGYLLPVVGLFGFIFSTLIINRGTENQLSV